MELNNQTIIAPILGGDSGGVAPTPPPEPTEINIRSSSGEISVERPDVDTFDLGVKKISPAVLESALENTSGVDEELHHVFTNTGEHVKLQSKLNCSKVVQKLISKLDYGLETEADGTTKTSLVVDGDNCFINQNVNIEELSKRLEGTGAATVTYEPTYPINPVSGKIKINVEVPEGKIVRSSTGQIDVITDVNSYDLSVVKLDPEVVKATFSDSDENDIWVGNDPTDHKLVAKIKPGGGLRKTIHDELFDKTSELGPIIQHSPDANDYDNAVKIVAGGTIGKEYVVFNHRHQAIVKSLIHGNAISGDVTAIGRYAGNNTKLELNVTDMVKGSKVKVDDDDWITKDWDSVNKALSLSVQPTYTQLFEMIDDGRNIEIEESEHNIDDSHPERGKKIKISSTGGGTGTITAGQLHALIDQSGEVKSKVVGNAVTMTMDRASLKNHIFSQEEAHNAILKSSTDITVKTKGSDNYELEIKSTSPAVNKAKTMFTKTDGSKVHIDELTAGNGTSLIEVGGRVTVISTSNLNVRIEDDEGGEIVKPVDSIQVEGGDKTHEVLEKTLFLKGVQATHRSTNLGVMSGLKSGPGITLSQEMTGGKPNGNIIVRAQPEIAASIDGDLKSINKISTPANTAEWRDSNRTLHLLGISATTGGNTDQIKQITVTNNATTPSRVSGGHLQINIPAAGVGPTPTPGNTIKVKGSGQPEFNASSLDFDASFIINQRSEGADTIAVIKNKGIITSGPDSSLLIDTNAIKIDGGNVKLKREGTEGHYIAHYEIKTPIHGNNTTGATVGDYFDRLTFDNKHFTVTTDTTTASGLKIANIAFLHDIDSIFLGCFDTPTALKEAAVEVDVPFKAGRIVGLLRKSLPGDTGKTKGFTVWKWKNTSITNPSQTDCKNDANWDYTVNLSADEYGIVELGQNSGSPEWRPDTSSENGYEASKHRGQIVWYTKQTDSPHETGHYWSDGTSWHIMATGPNIQVTGFDATSSQIGKTANKIDFGKNLVATIKGTGANQFMSIDSRGLIVSKKGSSVGTNGIHALEFEGATVTSGPEGSGLAKIKIEGGAFSGINYRHTSLDGTEKTFTNIKNVHLTGGLVTEEGDDGISIKAILPQNMSFLGIYDSPSDLLTAAKSLKIPFAKFKISGMVQRRGKDSTTRIVGYDLWHWNIEKTNPTETEIGTDTNWARTMLSALGQSTLHLGVKSIYPRWTPTDSTTYPANVAPGQVIWYTNAGVEKGHYYSDGTSWHKLSNGGSGHINITGFKEDDTTESTIDNVTSIKFTGGFIKGTDGSNLELVSGIHSEIKKSKTDPVSPGTATHWQETIKAIEVNGDTSMFSYDQDNHALNLLLWNTADSTSGTQLQADHPAASNPGRMGYTTGDSNELYVVNRTNTQWEMIGRKDLPRDFDALYKRFPETIAEVSTYTEKKETGYVFVNRENVQKSIADGGLGLTKGDQGILLNLYTGTGQRWVQMFYEMTNNNVWSRSHGQGTGSSSGTWNSWQQVSGVDDGCYSIMTIDNDKTAKDVSDANYKMPYVISQDPRANIIPVDEEGAFRVRRTGKYNINCIAQFTWEGNKVPAETPNTTGAFMGIYEGSTERWKIETTENVYDATKKEFHPLQGQFTTVTLQEGKVYHVVVALTRASSDEKALLELDPFKNMISIDPSNSDSKTGYRIMKNLYRSLGGISFGTGNEVRIEEKTSDDTIRVFGEKYLTEFKTLTKTE